MFIVWVQKDKVVIDIIMNIDGCNYCIEEYGNFKIGIIGMFL